MSFLLSKIIAKVIFGINYILDKIFKKKNLRFYIYEILRENYIEKIINGKKTLFSVPVLKLKEEQKVFLQKNLKQLNSLIILIKILKIEKKI